MVDRHGLFKDNNYKKRQPEYAIRGGGGQQIAVLVLNFCNSLYTGNP